MTAAERRSDIRRRLRESSSVTVAELSRLYYASESTIRRDLDKLADDGSVRRTYGGAFMMQTRSNELPITIRELENIEAKTEIARSAVKLIRDGATIILDTSSTVTAMVPLLSSFDALTVVTNGIKTAYLLNSCGKITTFCTGGRLREHNMSLVGSTAVERLEEINADIAFISCRGFSAEKGVTEASEEEAKVKKAMIGAAEKTVLLCDSTKIDMVLMNRVCGLDKLYAFITDNPLPPELSAKLKSGGVAVIDGTV